MKKYLIISLFICLLISGCKSENTLDLTPSVGLSNSNRIIVYISGEVKYPGIYEIESSNLLIDLVTKAGGFTNNANLTNLNLASPLNNNAMIVVPSLNEESNGQSTTLININVATLEELTTLSKIGKAKAQSIIDYRSENGFFRSIEDLLNVPGIGEGIFNEIKNSITV